MRSRAYLRVIREHLDWHTKHSQIVTAGTSDISKRPKAVVTWCRSKLYPTVIVEAGLVTLY